MPTEADQMSFWQLAGLAAGGVIGSGWLHSVPKVDDEAPGLGWWAWGLGCVAMLLVAVIMVEVGIAIRRTGGLVFHPLHTSGPLVATMVAAALWIAYAANPVTQASTITRNLAEILPELKLSVDEDTVWTSSIWLMLVVMVVIFGINLLPDNRVLQVNLWLTVAKVLVLVLLVTVLTAAPAPAIDPTSQSESGSIVSSLLLGGIIWAYIGFQAPLDFAGNTRRDRLRPIWFWTWLPNAHNRSQDHTRIRAAVYGTVVGSFLIYGFLQHAYNKVETYNDNRTSTGNEEGVGPHLNFLRDENNSDGVLAWFAPNLLEPLVRIIVVLAPLGSAIVFTYVLTREVAALSRARLIHHGLQATRYSRLPGGQRTDAYWLILIINFLIGLVLLAVAGHDWIALTAMNTVPILLLYAISGVVVAAYADARFSGRWATILRWLAPIEFLIVTGIIHGTTPETVLPGILATFGLFLLLLGLPWIATRNLSGKIARWIDTQDLFSRMNWSDPGTSGLIALLGYIALLMLGSAVPPLLGADEWVDWLVRAVALCGSWLLFRWMVSASKKWQAGSPPDTTAVQVATLE